ncbi:GbpC/Spa domain-containing protein [Streptococcus thoraltensis]|uniref:GbpC/Spa domain-containing protein n=1 Tax=Streptococcus thoraltensis TaxID=55085 RepID=UPI00035CC2B1|nr:GbpC/Spa domain-containing protein [Streptococcus thoraltensis]
MEQRNQKLRIVSGVLFSSALFVCTQTQVLADTIPSSASSLVSTEAVANDSRNPSLPMTTSGDSQLDSSLTKAQKEGILLVEAPTETVTSASEQAQDYQSQVGTVEAVTKRYQAEKAQYHKDDQNYKDYLTKQSQFQKDLVTYQAYQKEKAIYDQKLKVYNLEKASYDMAYAEAQGNTTKRGYLPEVLAQNLIFKLEPDAIQTITGKVLSDEQLHKAVKHQVGWIDPGTILGSPKLVTLTSRHKDNSVLLAVGDSVVVDYSDLKNSSFSGYAIKKVRYTYKLISTTHYSGTVVFQALSDPTVTSLTHIYNKDKQTKSAFDMEMTVQFFDINGKELIPTPDNYALTSFASLNSLNGEGEYAGDYNGQFIPINGSTITVQNGRAANFTSTEQIDVVGEWDDKDNPNAYIGAIVGKSTDRIRFHFGNSKGYANWFAFSSDVKVSGGLLTPPKAPTAPEVVMKPVVPTLVSKPTPPHRPIIFYHQVKVSVPKPAKPVKPVKSSSKKPTIRVPKSVSVVKANTVAYRPKPIPVYYTLSAVTPTPSTLNYLKKLSPKIVYKFTKVKSGVGNQRANSNEKNQSNKPETAEEWFNYNTGVGNSQKNDNTVIKYINSLGEVARRKYKGDKLAQNREIAQAIADKTYYNDTLQNFFNYFGKPIRISNKSIQKSAINQINKAHDENKGKIDFAHLATTLASYERQPGFKGFTKEVIKTISTGKVIMVGNIPVIVPDLFMRENSVLQQNSFVGDLFTDMPVSDVYTDMDIMILSRHPKYKDMSMDKRLIAYYSQDLTQQRQKLFKEVFDKSKKTSQLRLGVELLYTIASAGTIGLLAYSLKKGTLKNIPKNIHRIDTMLFDRKIDKFKKASQTMIKKNIIKPLKNKAITTKKAFQRKITTLTKKFSPKTIAKNIYINRVARPLQLAKKVYRSVSKIKPKTIAKNIYINRVARPLQLAKKFYRSVSKIKPKTIAKNIYINRVARPLQLAKKVYHKIFPPTRKRNSFPRRSTKRRRH